MINGVAAVPIMAMIMLMASREKVMGEFTANEMACGVGLARDSDHGGRRCWNVCDLGKLRRRSRGPRIIVVRVLTLYANPVVASFGAALHRQVVTTLQGRGHDFDTRRMTFTAAICAIAHMRKSVAGPYATPCRDLSALAEPTRLAALGVLWDGGEHCVCELMAKLGASHRECPVT